THRFSVPVPIEIDGCSQYASNGIVRQDLRGAIIRVCCLSVAPKVLLAEGDLLEQSDIPRVHTKRLLQEAESFLGCTLPPYDIAFNFRYSGVVRQTARGNLQFGLRSFVVAQCVVEVAGACEVGLG